MSSPPCCPLNQTSSSEMEDLGMQMQAYSAIVQAVMAVVAGLATFAIAILAYRVSEGQIRPLLTISCDDRNDMVSVVLKNAGGGPAYITRVAYALPHEGSAPPREETEAGVKRGEEECLLRARDVDKSTGVWATMYYNHFDNAASTVRSGLASDVVEAGGERVLLRFKLVSGGGGGGVSDLPHPYARAWLDRARGKLHRGTITVDYRDARRIRMPSYTCTLICEPRMKGTKAGANITPPLEGPLIGLRMRLVNALGRLLGVTQVPAVQPSATPATQAGGQQQAGRPPPFRLDVAEELVHDIVLQARPHDFDGFDLGVSDRAPRGILQMQHLAKEECCRALQTHLQQPAALPNNVQLPQDWQIKPETDAQLVWDEGTNVCAAVHVHVRFGDFEIARAVAEAFESPQLVRTVPAGAAPAAAGAAATAAATAPSAAPAAPPAPAPAPPAAAAAAAAAAAKTLLVSAHVTPGSELCSWIAAERNVITVTPSYNLTADAMKRLLLYKGRDRWLSDVVRVTYRTVDDVFVAEVTTGTQLVESIPHKLTMHPGVDLKTWVHPRLRGYEPKLAPVWEFELTSLYR